MYYDFFMKNIIQNLKEIRPKLGQSCRSIHILGHWDITMNQWSTVFYLLIDYLVKLILHIHVHTLLECWQ